MATIDIFYEKYVSRPPVHHKTLVIDAGISQMRPRAFSSHFRTYRDVMAADQITCAGQMFAPAEQGIWFLYQVCLLQESILLVAGIYIVEREIQDDEYQERHRSLSDRFQSVNSFDRHQPARGLVEEELCEGNSEKDR